MVTPPTPIRIITAPDGTRWEVRQVGIEPNGMARVVATRLDDRTGTSKIQH